MAIDLDTHLTLQDKVRLWLGERGTRYVPLATDDISADLGITPYQAYQTLARLQSRKEIEIESSDNRVIGVTINKLEPSSRTYRRAADKAKESIIDEPTHGIENMTFLREYLEKKLAITKMRQKAIEAGLDPDSTVVFEENPVAEEGLLLLDLLKNVSENLAKARRDLQTTSFDLDAAKRDNEVLKGKLRQETNRELLAFASG